MGKTTVSYTTRLEIYERDGYKCYSCGRKVQAGKKEKRKNFIHATLDHYIPKSLGGSSNADNLKTCCKTCNSNKGSKLPIPIKKALWFLLLTKNPLVNFESEIDISIGIIE